MPELPEVETVRRGLAPAMEGSTIERLELRRPDLRFPFPDRFAERLKNRSITSLGRRAKYLLCDLDDESVVIMHLGMSGSFQVEIDEEDQVPGEFHHPRSRIKAHDHVIFHLTDSSHRPVKIVYNDPRRFGFMLMCNRAELPEHPSFKDLGVEPVGNELSAEILAERFASKTTTLKATLLDQRIIAGLGNIYVCEALWRTGLSPKREAGSIVNKSGKPSKKLVLLVDSIRDIIAEAIKAGGSSLRDHAQTDGTLGYFQHSFSSYDREGHPCAKPDCNGVIRRIVQSGRSTFYCASCQR